MTEAQLAYLEDFSKWKTDLYFRETHLSTFLKEIYKAFYFTVSQYEITLFHYPTHGAVVFHEPNSEKAQVGFLHFSGEEEKDQSLWNEVVTYLKDKSIKKLVGPIQGATYFPYRFLVESDGSPFFTGEYFSSVEDHEFMLAQNPSKVLYFKSAYRTEYENIIKISEPYYEKLTKQGLRLESHQEVSQELFHKVFELVLKVFGQNWNFQSLSEKKFQNIYQDEMKNTARLKMHTLYFKDKLIGFIRYVEDSPNTLICKTIGILPEYQKMGIGNAAVAQMHWDALKHNYTKMIYALVYDGNRVKDMPQDDAIIFRKYASYEFTL